MESGFQAEAEGRFREFVLEPDFPCLGARAAFHAGSYTLNVYEELASEGSSAQLVRDLSQFLTSELRGHEFASLIAIFRTPERTDEQQFENLLWRQLTMVNEHDTEPWDAQARSDPADPMFSFSFAGQALYVVGMHANSCRQSRRFRWPTLVFNPHEQFERLRTEGKWKRMQQSIRQRDEALQGSINPMLSDFGESSEARQYSGRVVEENWRAPFTPANGGRCPFHR